MDRYILHDPVKIPAEDSQLEFRVILSVSEIGIC